MNKGEVKPSQWDVNYKAGKRLYKDYANVVRPRGPNGEERGGRPEKFPVWSRDPSKENIYSHEAMGVPNGDPAEKFDLLNMCLFEDIDPEVDAPVTFGGFAQEYYEREMHDLENLGHTFDDRTDFAKKRSPAMHVFLPEQVGVFTQLVEEFGCSDTYFSSAPCQTWPNRHFVMTGHCYGYVNNLADSGTMYDHDKMKVPQTMHRLLQFTSPVIFDKLLEHGVEYSIYAGDCPLSVALSRNLNGTDELERVYDYEDFKRHVQLGRLAPYTFIEPSYLKHGDDLPNDMHPPHNVKHAQSLVARTYNALRSNPHTWSKTLFIVNCDEGVGVFDHVPPPAAPNPNAGENHWFGSTVDQEPPESWKSHPFERYGTRVPCVLASPLLEKGSVIRPSAEFANTPPGWEGDEVLPFDHCSVIRTVFDLFVGVDYHLTDRDLYAPSIAPYLLSEARREGRDLGPLKLDESRPMDGYDPAAKREKHGMRGGCHNAKDLMKLFHFKNKDEEFNVDDLTSTEWLFRQVRHLSSKTTTGYTHHLYYHEALVGYDGYKAQGIFEEDEDCEDEGYSSGDSRS